LLILISLSWFSFSIASFFVLVKSLSLDILGLTGGELREAFEELIFGFCFGGKAGFFGVKLF
jgi:hypothetical protein